MSDMPITPSDIIDAKLNSFTDYQKLADKTKRIMRETCILGFSIGQQWHNARLSNKLDQLLKEKLINQFVYKKLIGE